MKRIFGIVTILALMLSSASCEKPEPPKRPGAENQQPGGEKPDNEKPGNNDSGAENPGNGNPGEGNTDRADYQIIQNSYAKGEMQFYGIYYDDQPEDVHNWALVLSEADFDFIYWEGSGYCVNLELFTSSSAATELSSGKYTVEAFLEEGYVPMSVGDGIIHTEEETGDEYCLGTWLYEDGMGIAGATAGEVTFEKKDGQYKVSYVLYDDYERITFKGSYTGQLDYYDGTAEYESLESKSCTPTWKRRPAHFSRRNARR